jgi:hypothetical protein
MQMIARRKHNCPGWTENWNEKGNQRVYSESCQGLLQRGVHGTQVQEFDSTQSVI